MPDIVNLVEGAKENIIMYRWAFGGKAATLAELQAKFAPGQDKLVYLVGKDAYAWDDDASDFILVGQWHGPVGPAGEGIPIGGTTGQVLIKSGNADFESAWVDLTLKTTAPLSGGGNVVDGLTLAVADATTTKRGVVRIATSAETSAGVKDNAYVSPAKLKEQLDTIRADVAAINSMPVGTVFEFAAETPPEGALAGDGSLAPIVDFPELFGVIGYVHTPSGSTPPSGYFYLPDYRDKFLRGHNPRGSRKFGSEQSDALQNITGSFDMRRCGINATGSSVTSSDDGICRIEYSAGETSTWHAAEVSGQSERRDRIIIDLSLSARTSSETRPVNKTILICIKY